MAMVERYAHANAAHVQCALDNWKPLSDPPEWFCREASRVGLEPMPHGRCKHLH